MTSNGVGTCGADDNQEQAGHLIPVATEREREFPRTFQKVIRSGARDVNGDLPPEVWAERDIAATLSLHDLGSDTRAVEVVVDAVTTLGDHTHALTSEGYDASEDGTGRGTPIIAATLTAGTSRPGINPPGRRQEDDQNIVVFDPKAGGDRTSSGAQEDGTGITPTLGGARPHAVAFHLTQDPISGAVSPALGAKSGGQGDALPTATETTVRRLTPLECERLQGFPDGWTEGQSDSHRYKQMGNAVAVPVFEWVARRLIAIDQELRKS